MIPLIYTLALAFCFAALIGFSLLNLVIGFVISYFVLSYLPRLPRTRAFRLPIMETGGQLKTFRRRVLYVIWDFLRDLTLSNFLIAEDAWTPTDKYRPDIVHVPVHDLGPLQIMLLSSRITLTPGTLSCDVTADKQYLLVHVMYMRGKSRQEVARDLRRPADILMEEVPEIDP